MRGPSDSRVVDPIADDDVKQRIVRFVGQASTRSLRPMKGVFLNLPSGYRLARRFTWLIRERKPGRRCSVRRLQSARRLSCDPHIVARRIANALTLRKALAELRAGGLDQSC